MTELGPKMYQLPKHIRNRPSHEVRSTQILQDWEYFKIRFRDDPVMVSNVGSDYEGASPVHLRQRVRPHLAKLIDLPGTRDFDKLVAPAGEEYRYHSLLIRGKLGGLALPSRLVQLTEVQIVQDGLPLIDGPNPNIIIPPSGEIFMFAGSMRRIWSAAQQAIPA